MRFLFIDRMLYSSASGDVRGLKHVTREDYYLCRDEQDKACFVPSLVGEALGQLAAWNVMERNDFTRRPVAGVVASAHLYRPAYVGETIVFAVQIDELDETAVRYHGTASIDDDVIFRVDGALGPLLPMKDFISETEIRHQFAEINRPGEMPALQRTSDADKQVDARGLSLVVLQFDHIVHCEPGVSISAEKRITRAASYFPDHFPRHPVLPMTVLLECQLNLAREFLARSSLAEQYKIDELRRIKMNDFVHPGDIVRCNMKVKSQDAEKLVLSFRSEVNGSRVCVMDAVLVAKGVS